MRLTARRLHFILCWDINTPVGLANCSQCNTLPPAVRDPSITPTQYCAFLNTVFILQSLWNTTTASLQQFTLQGLLCQHKFTYLLTTFHSLDVAVVVPGVFMFCWVPFFTINIVSAVCIRYDLFDYSSVCHLDPLGVILTHCSSRSSSGSDTSTVSSILSSTPSLTWNSVARSTRFCDTLVVASNIRAASW